MKKRVLILGGDKRQLYAAKNFIDSGYETGLFGFSQIKDESLYFYNSMKEAIERSDIIVLPMPVTRNNIFLNAPLNEENIPLEEIYSLITREKRLYGGMINKGFFEKTDFIFDYAQSEELLIRNAVLTAEGALGTIISLSPLSIQGTDILILGYGRIGKVLADYIKYLGGIPVVCARKEKDFAWCKARNTECIDYFMLKNSISRFGIIINTVPAKVITEDVINKIKKDSFVIDLASKDGGCDFEKLSKAGVNHLHALGIPGKTAPQTAGKIISDIIISNEKRTEDIWKP